MRDLRLGVLKLTSEDVLDVISPYRFFEPDNL